MHTEQLIETLARDLAAVAPLPSPARRALAWGLGAVLFAALVTAAMSSSGDVMAAAATPRILLAHVIAFGVTAAGATAAFASVVPGYPRRILALALIGVAVWTAVLVVGEPAGTVDRAVAASGEWRCIAMILCAGGAAAAVMARMLRNGAPLNAPLTAALAWLPAASLANVAACVTHPHPSGTVVLLWHGGTIAVVVGVAAVSGPALFRWPRSTGNVAPPNS